MMHNVAPSVASVPWPRLNDEKWRLRTFACYPTNALKSALMLAKNGFAYNGTGQGLDDSVVCYFCAASKQCWREDESIEETHRVLNPNCPIVTGAACDNIPWGQSENAHQLRDQVAANSRVFERTEIGNEAGGSINSQREREQQRVTSTNSLPQSSENRPLISTSNEVETASQTNSTGHVRSGTGLSSEHSRFQNPTCHQLGIVTEKPKWPDYAVPIQRWRTFDNWTRSHPKKSELARAGFIYIGPDDRVVCFFCGGMLRDWQINDNPWIEHARRYPLCGYVRQRGRSFVDAVKALYQIHQSVTLQMVLEYMNTDESKFQMEDEMQGLMQDPAVKVLIEKGYEENQVLSAATKLTKDGEMLSADKLLSELNVASSADEKWDLAQREGDKIREKYLCVHCKQRQKCVIYLPCGHIATCQPCYAFHQHKCPECGNQVARIIRTRPA